jgi:hypothetical protein
VHLQFAPANLHVPSPQCCKPAAAPLSSIHLSFPSLPHLSPDRLRRWKVLEPSEMRRSRRQRNGGGGGSGQRGGRVAVAFAVLLGCVMALVGGAAAQGPRLPSDYKTLSGTVTHPSPSIPALQLSRRVSSSTPLLPFVRLFLYDGGGACFPRGL